MWRDRLTHTDLLPDWLIRFALRVALARNTRHRYKVGVTARHAAKRALIARLRESPIAIHTSAPNRQHYEVPAAFFQLVLGPRLKYSCCYWPEGVRDLNGAEEAMLALTCQRAQVEDGMEILDLGCGWGSLSLWIAERYPNSRVVAVSNARSQREFIAAQCDARGIGNVQAITADVARFEIERRFDRVLSVEMFEHMKNYGLLLRRISGFLKPEGRLFVHIFCHREFAYEFNADDVGNWMAQTFFTGGTMPSDDLLLHFQEDLTLVDHWRESGTHYARTLRSWRERLDRRRPEVRRVLADTYGVDQVTKWLVNWRLFFLACEETWRMKRGQEYLVSHYLFRKRDR
jgi:cyclopropane-fatty-acyl-phospholipid synthase